MNYNMTEDELQLCMDVIDADKSGTISFEEFALWFIGGKEGTPNAFGGQLGTFMTSTSKYNNTIIKKLTNAIRDMQVV